MLRSAYLELIGYAGTLRRFPRACDTSFKYLIDNFGFRGPEFQPTGSGGLVKYENATTIVEIHLDWREELLFVYLRPVPSAGRPDNIPEPGVLLDTLLLHRGSQMIKQADVLGRRLREVISEYAFALRVHADAALRGDFSEVTAAAAAFPNAPRRIWRGH